jgi:competence protein CoiA
MKFALVDNNRIEASKGAKGICPSCGSELTTKCGPDRINHWAHKKGSTCDPWWENETEWHRSWKNNYPEDWQEFTLSDNQTGEKHIADIRTDYELVIELQHSHIDLEERISRETFYKKMVWIVDGTRLKRDYPRFLKGKDYLRRTKMQGCFIVDFPDECFPSAWINSSAPVIFDFLGRESIEDRNDLRNSLYCLFPAQKNREAILANLSREIFIKKTIYGEWFSEQQEIQKQSAKPPVVNTIIEWRKEPTHYYDQKKGRFVKKWRF